VRQRFLIVAPAFLEWDLGRYLERLLSERGVECRTFAYRGFPSQALMNERLLQLAAEYGPDVVLGLKIGSVAPETVTELRSRGALVVLWYVDCWDGNVPPAIASLFRVVDVFLTTAAGMLPKYRVLGPTPAYWVHEGVYLPAFPPLELPPAQAKIYASEVAFVGNLFHPPVPDENLALRRYRLLGKVCERHRLKIWGQQGDPRASEKWPFRQCPLIHWPAFHEEVVKICRATDVVLGINTVNFVERYFSNRTFLTLASGGFHLTHYVPGLETMFENHRHLVWYRSDEECLELIDHYLPRQDERWRIAREGQAWTRRRYGMGRQVNKILRIVGKHRGG
jgi:hypothetical protein